MGEPSKSQSVGPSESPSVHSSAEPSGVPPCDQRCVDVPDATGIPWPATTTHEEFRSETNNWLKTRVSQYGNIINCWNTALVSSMQQAFYPLPGVDHSTYMSPFNDRIDCWDTSSVESFVGTLSHLHSFNQDINSWDVSSVENIISLIESTKKFNQAFDSWNVASVTLMNAFAKEAKSFNQNLCSWKDVPTRDGYKIDVNLRSGYYTLFRNTACPVQTEPTRTTPQSAM